MTSEPEHRVSTHLGVDAGAYDVAIRRFVPHYDAMIAVIISMLDETLGDSPLVIDLGAGTGALSAAILDEIPRARVQLVDIDPSMLAVAGARVARHGARAELRKASFHDVLPACDAVVASLSLHHVAELERKRALYTQIHDALRPGGVLLSADATVHETGPERARGFREWAGWMAAHGIAEAEARALFAQWSGEDHYYPLAVELDLIAAAGFVRPECFWKHGPSTVFGGFKVDHRPA